MGTNLLEFSIRRDFGAPRGVKLPKARNLRKKEKWFVTFIVARALRYRVAGYTHAGYDKRGTKRSFANFVPEFMTGLLNPNRRDFVNSCFIRNTIFFFRVPRPWDCVTKRKTDFLG